MTRSPIFWGAGVACALAGAVAGSALGSTPVLDRPTLGENYTSHDDSQTSQAARKPPPDHYPLVTKAGTVPVGELGQRGLYSQARYRAVFAAIEPSPTSIVEDDFGHDHGAHVARAAPAALGAGSAAEAPTEASIEVESGETLAAHDGHGAKMIDVAATLAMR